MIIHALLPEFRSGLRRSTCRLARCEEGSTLVELAIVLSVFLLIFFGLVDFGRLAFHYVAAEKAMQVAARVAAVRPPACAGVPEVNVRGPVAPSDIPPNFGSLCREGANICANPGIISCTGAAGNGTASEIWALVRGALPNDATIANLNFSYAFDSNLGFLGGPYVPVVTVEVQNLNFEFVSPLSALVGLSGAVADPALGAAIPFPAMSVSLPAEDLALGNNG
jgi:TadE-like protein